MGQQPIYQFSLVRTLLLAITCSVFASNVCKASVGKSYVIVAKAPLRTALEKQLIKSADRVVALDGAVDVLLGQGIVPHIVVGDLDSIDKSTRKRIPLSVQVVHTPDQSKTDLEKGIEYCDQFGAGSILVINAIGGRMDHTLWNVQLLKKYYRSQRALFLVTNRQSVSYHKNETVFLYGSRGDNCGVFGAPEATVTSQGLMYNMKDRPLKFGVSGSVSNALAGPRASVSIKGEAIVVKPLAG